MNAAIPDPAGLVGDVAAAIEEASAYAFSTEAAMAAALDHLELASHAEAILIASALATLIAMDLNPTVARLDLSEWLTRVTAVMAERGRPAHA